MGFAPSRDDASDAAAMVPSLCGIPGGSWQVSTPAPLDDVNALLVGANPGPGDRSEFDPVFSPDGLELHVTSDQTLNWDIWIAKRTSIGAPFTTIARSPVSTTGVEFGYQPLPAVDAAVICADFGAADLDYHFGVDLATGPTWTRSSLSTASGDSDARLTPSGLEIYIVRGQPADGSRDIFIASRATVAEDFGPARPVPELNGEASDASPVPVGELEILFASQRATAVDTDDIYLASRAAAGEPFGPPVRLDELRSERFDGEPTVHVTPEGCEIVFVSNRSGVFNLYRSTVSRR